MSDDHIEMDGIVTDMANGKFRVWVEDAQAEVMCHLSGKMKRNKINVVISDQVSIKVSPYDMERGFITFRKG